MSQNELQQMIGQEIKFLNPLGRVNNITITAKNIYKVYTELQADGYEILRPKRPRVHVSDDICISCSG